MGLFDKFKKNKSESVDKEFEIYPPAQGKINSVSR